MVGGDGTVTTKVVHTACTLDCPDACSLAVTVESSALGERIVKVDAGPGNPLTDGWICAKVRRSAERVHSPERVLTPLVRVGPKGAGEFRPASWEAAIALVADRIRDAIDHHSADAVVAYTYNSSSARLEKQSASEAFFAAIGSTVAEHTICAHTVSEAWSSVYGDMGSADPADVVYSDLIVLWGANPSASNVHVAEKIREAQRRGARLVVVDPRATPLAQRSDLHLPVLPGTDVVLAYAVANRWVARGSIDHAFMRAHAVEGADDFLAAAADWTPERAAGVCGVPVADIERLADWWAGSARSMLRLGWGQERNRNGFASCRAVLALPVLGGHFPRDERERGRGVAHSLSVSDLSGLSPRGRWPHEAIAAAPRRSVPMHQIGSWMAPDTDDPCRVLFVQGSNPMVMCPDTLAVRAAFERDDVFTVVHEQVLTDTARYADVVLPATTSFELDDVAYAYGATAVMPVRAAISPVGESRSNDQVGLALAASFGFDWTIEPVAAVVGVGDREAFTAKLPTLQFVDTVDRIRLTDAVHGVPVFTPLDGGFAVLSPSSTKMINSIFGEFQGQPVDVQVHPTDAAALGVVDGDLVDLVGRVTNASVRVPVRVTPTVRPGVLVMPKGVWLRNHVDGLGVSALAPATGDPVTNGACFNDARVDVHRVADRAASDQPRSVAAPAN